MTYNPRENKKYVGIIVDRDGPDNSCKVFLPEIHGVNVNIDDLGYSRFKAGPDASGASTSHGTPDNGQMVSCTVNTTGGSTLVEIDGLYQTKQTSSPSNPGNDSLNLVFPQWATAIALTSNIRVPPETISESTVEGAKVRTPQERSQLHAHNLLMGINSTGAQPPLNGSILPSMSAGTAVQPSATAAAFSMLGGLMPGMSMSMGSLLGSTVLSALSGVLPPAMLATFGSTVGLMTTQTPSTTSITVKPNTEIVIKNAKRLLRNANTQAEIAYITQELLNNNQLHYESSRKVTVATTTDYGDSELVIDFANGTISMQMSNAASAAMAAFSSMLSSIEGANGALFGNSSSTIQSMGDRLADETKKAEFKVRTKDNASQTEGNEPRKKSDEKAITFLGVPV